MLRWCAIFTDKPQTVAKVEESDDRGDVVARFALAKEAMAVDGRAVKSMWLIDRGSEQLDVIRVAGDNLPGDLWPRHNNYLAGRNKKPPD